MARSLLHRGMSTSYVAYHPEQQQLLPPALQDWLPHGHLAYFISDTVDSLNLSAFHARYAVGGSRNQPLHPAMMVKVLVYAYATGVFSSRKITRRLHEDIAFRVLAADNFPAHRTIRDFRAQHLAEFTELFTQVVRLAREMGLVKLGTIAVDGTKVTSTDVQQLPMVLDAVQTHTGAQPAQVLADAAYRSEAVMAKLAQVYPNTELVIALGREGKARATPKNANRYPHTVAMAAKFQTEQTQKDYRKRKWIAEPPNGWIKNVLGFRQFSMRGLEKAQAEFKLVCMALNLRRMGAMQTG